MTVSEGLVSIETIGVPHIVSDLGEDITPKGVRLRAILVVIALSPNKQANRRWLETMFWPDRSSDQASGSLRQALTSIRRSLGSYSDILKADRLDVTLDMHRVRVDLVDFPKTALEKLHAGRVLLEGTDIASDVFEDWLRQERSILQDRLDRAGRGAGADPLDVKELLHRPIPHYPVLFTEPQSSTASLENFLAEAICSQLAKTATSHIRTEVRLLDGLLAPSIVSPGSKCSIRVTGQNGVFHVIARLTEEPKGKVYWFRQVTLDDTCSEAVIDAAASLAQEATEAFAACSAQASDAQKANGLATQALEDIFSFDPDRIKAADEKLSLANELDPYAPRPALQALGRAYHALEDPTCDREALKVEVDDLFNQSLALDSANPLALAFLADVQDLVFDDPQTALSFLSCALRNNPGIGYAYASLGALELRRGRTKEAQTAAIRAQRQLENTSMEVFSLMRLCVTNMNMGDISEASLAAQRAAELAPFSCPPLRHLYALRLSQGNEQGAREALVALRRMEPEFSMRQIREDPAFPAPSLRRMGFHQLTDVDL